MRKIEQCLLDMDGGLLSRVSQGRLRENEYESKFLVQEIYIRSYEREAWEVLQGGSMGPAGRNEGRGLWLLIAVAWGTDPLGRAGSQFCSGGGGTLFTSSRGGWSWKGPAPGKDNRVPQGRDTMTQS